MTSAASDILARSTFSRPNRYVELWAFGVSQDDKETFLFKSCGAIIADYEVCIVYSSIIKEEIKKKKKS